MVTGGATTGGTIHLNPGRDSNELSQEEEEISRGLGRQERREGSRRCLGRINHGLEEQRSSSLARMDFKVRYGHRNDEKSSHEEITVHILYLFLLECNQTPSEKSRFIQFVGFAGRQIQEREDREG